MAAGYGRRVVGLARTIRVLRFVSQAAAAGEDGPSPPTFAVFCDLLTLSKVRQELRASCMRRHKYQDIQVNYTMRPSGLASEWRRQDQFANVTHIKGS